MYDKLLSVLPVPQILLFRVYTLSVLFGLFHGLVFLPVLLNLAGGGGNLEQPVSWGDNFF